MQRFAPCGLLNADLADYVVPVNADIGKTGKRLRDLPIRIEDLL